MRGPFLRLAALLEGCGGAGWILRSFALLRMTMGRVEVEPGGDGGQARLMTFFSK